MLGRRCLAWGVLGCLQSACPASAAWRPPGATHRLRPCSSMLRTPSLPPKSLHHPGSSHCLQTGTAAAAAGTVPGLCSTGEACVSCGTRLFSLSPHTQEQPLYIDILAVELQQLANVLNRCHAALHALVCVLGWACAVGKTVGGTHVGSHLGASQQQKCV